MSAHTFIGTASARGRRCGQVRCVPTFPLELSGLLKGDLVQYKARGGISWGYASRAVAGCWKRMTRRAALTARLTRLLLSSDLFCVIVWVAVGLCLGFGFALVVVVYCSLCCGLASTIDGSDSIPVSAETGGSSGSCCAAAGSRGLGSEPRGRRGTAGKGGG